MKKTVLSLLAVSLLCLTGSLYAETQYVSDELRVPLRKTPCSRCTIIHHGLKAGTALNVIETNEEGWVHVTTSSGLDGWIPGQYLTKQQIAKHRIAKVEQQLTKANSEKQALQQQIRELTDANASLEAQLATAHNESSNISSELNNVRQISANAISIHQQNEDLLTKNSMLQNELDILSATNEQLRSDEKQSWFLYGGLAVFMGAMLVVLIPRLKRKKKFSEWG